MVFCTVKIFFKEHDGTLIYTVLKLCKVFFGTPGSSMVKEKYEDFLELSVKQLVIQSRLTSLG